MAPPAASRRRDCDTDRLGPLGFETEGALAFEAVVGNVMERMPRKLGVGAFDGRRSELNKDVSGR